MLFNRGFLPLWENKEVKLRMKFYFAKDVKLENMDILWKKLSFNLLGNNIPFCKSILGMVI